MLRGLYLKLEPAAILALHEPQHIAFHLHEGEIEEIVARHAALFLPSSLG